MSPVYSPNQIAETWRHLPRVPHWFVSVGLGYGDECERVKARFPRCRIVGIDPHPDVFAHHAPVIGRQLDGVCLPLAVTDEIGTTTLKVSPVANRSSLVRDIDHDKTLTVPTTTLDAVARKYGPWDRTYLWIDAEGSEEMILLGAADLFAHRRIDVVNVECLTGSAAAIHTILNRFKMRQVYAWNGGTAGEDRVYVRNDLRPGGR